jgi:hypothetical protein
MVGLSVSIDRAVLSAAGLEVAPRHGITFVQYKRKKSGCISVFSLFTLHGLKTYFFATIFSFPD